MTDQITMENNYLYKIELKDKENILIVKNLITNEDINLSLFNANEQEISNIFENVTNNLWNIEEKDLEKSEIINLSLIKEDKENINNQIVLTFANIFNREIKLIKEDILKLTNYLELEQDCYFLDEPENGLDNHFINEIIVQKINKLARDGKAVIIVTHNANIGVRTLPYLTIYRELNKNQNTENKTYLGNSFKETMHNIQNEETDFIWADICEKILEGGEEAFNDRSNYYGK